MSEDESMKLSAEDSRRVAESLLNTREPGERLKRAMRVRRAAARVVAEDRDALDQLAEYEAAERDLAEALRSHAEQYGNADLQGMDEQELARYLFGTPEGEVEEGSVGESEGTARA